MATQQLLLHEQALLLCLNDTDGAPAFLTDYRFAVAGGIIAELVIHGKLSVPEPSKDSTAHPITDHPTGHRVLDDYFELIARRPYPATIESLITELADDKDLRDKAATGLIDLGIVREDRASIAGFFSRKAFPQMDREPKREMIARMRKAIFENSDSIDERTAVLITLANAASLLTLCFDKDDLAYRRDRLALIAQGDTYAQATASAIASVHSTLPICVMVAKL